jgi:superfamily I DNA and/or RNA helicase
MNEAIMSLCNELIYGKTMSCGTPMIAKGLLKLPFLLEKLLWPAMNQNQSIVVVPDSTKKMSSLNRSDWLFQALLRCFL